MTGSGATVPVQSIKACVVYDSTTGQIHHQHHVLTLVGDASRQRMRLRETRLKRSRADMTRHGQSSGAARPA